MTADPAWPVARRVAGWVALGFAIMFVASGIKSVYQVYFTDIAAHFGRPRAEFAVSGAVFMLVTGLASPLVGWMSDRVGPLRTVLCGCVLGGIALVACAAMPDRLSTFVVWYGLGAALALAAMTYVPMGVLVDRLFASRHKGLAYAVVGNGTALGFIVLSPFWIWLQAHVAWTSAFLALGLVFVGPLAIAVAIAARRRMPTLPAAPATERASPGDWSAVRRDPVFYALALGFFGCGATMGFVDVHLVPLWQDLGVARVRMGLGLSLLGALELASGIAAGMLASRRDPHAVLAGFYALRAVAMGLLLLGPHWSSVEAFVVVFGASYMGTVVLTSALCLDRYGSAIKGQVFGGLFLVHQLGAVASVQLGALAFDMTGNYAACAAVLAVLAATSGIVVAGTGRTAGARPHRLSPHAPPEAS